MDIQPVQTDNESLKSYEELFKACFPKTTHLDIQYLRWLYAENPAGAVVGFDAFSEGRLAAHYSCIPVDLVLCGEQVKGLLSLNTATHPDHQGKGLFTRLAAETYEAGSSAGFSCVYGVANANSTPGFIRKLDFQLVRPLEARVGIGGLHPDWVRIAETTEFSRNWTEKSFLWRCSNPKNPMTYGSRQAGVCGVSAPAVGRFISAYAEVPLEEVPMKYSKFFKAPLKLFLGLFPENSCGFGSYVEIPRRLRPSPLNLIFRHLRGNRKDIDPGKILLSFIDFDAY